MLSSDQKNVIYAAVLKAYTVETAEFNVNCIYNNQIIEGRVGDPVLSQAEGVTGYPIIILSYIPGGKIIGDIQNTVSWKALILSVDIYAKNYDSRVGVTGQIINGQVLCDELSRQFINDINDTWNTDSTLLAENVKLNIPVEDPTDLSDITGTPHIYRNHIDVNLIYKEE